MKIDKNTIKIAKLRARSAKMRPKRPKKATEREKRVNKRATPIVDSGHVGARGPWPGGRGVQLNNQKLRI